MKLSKILPFLCGLVLSWTASSQILYTAPIENIRELVHIAQRVQACDSLVLNQEKEINLGLKVIASKDSILVARSLTTALQHSEIKEIENRLAIQSSLTQIEKGKKRKWIFVSVGVGILAAFLAK